MTEQELREATIYFFGCTKKIEGNCNSGHYLYNGGLHTVSRVLDGCPWTVHSMDATLCPLDIIPYQDQYKAKLTHYKGWTALGFWDRSGDERPGSNSVFIMKGSATFEQVIEKAELYYPQLFKRFRKEITLDSIVEDTPAGLRASSLYVLQRKVRQVFPSAFYQDGRVLRPRDSEFNYLSGPLPVLLPNSFTEYDECSAWQLAANNPLVTTIIDKMNWKEVMVEPTLDFSDAPVSGVPAKA